MGRHDVLTRSRRGYNRGGRSIPLLAVISVSALVATMVLLGFDYLRGSSTSADECANPTPVTVAAAPEISAVVTQVAAEAPQDSESCYKIEVVARDSANTADWLAQATESERPDVWIPDSSVWLGRARDLGANYVPATATSLASTPVVMAMSEGAAIQRGWPQRQLDWTAVVGPNTELKVGIPDPSVDATGISAVLGVKAISSRAADPAAQNISLLRKVSPNATSGTSELYDKLLAATNNTGSQGADEIVAFPSAESALLRHNANHPNAPLVAVYPDPPVPSLDFPFAITTTDLIVTHAAQRFRSDLLSTRSAGAMGANGFRSPDGRVLGIPTPDERTALRHLRPVAAPDKRALDEALNAWASATRSSRVLLVTDVSGSMDAQVPGTGRNRMQIATEASAQGLTLFNPRTKVGFWIFSAGLDGDRDYREIVPTSTVSELLAGGIQNTLRGITAVPGGRTGLYDTTLAAYQSATRNWEPGRLNVVVITTDSRNDDNGSSITRDQLLAELRAMQDPARPLALVVIGIGSDIDTAELSQIAQAARGVSFTTADPAKIGDIYYAALSRISNPR